MSSWGSKRPEIEPVCSISAENGRQPRGSVAERYEGSAVEGSQHFFTVLPHKDPWKKHHTPPLCKSSFFGKSHPTHMFFLLLSQQKRRLRFRNLLWSSFIPSGSLMISPDPPIHNYTLLYGTIRFMKKERFSRSFLYPSRIIIRSFRPDSNMHPCSEGKHGPRYQ